MNISIHSELSLKSINEKDQEQLYNLMMCIYRPVYQHLWYDDGSGYVKSQYNLEHLIDELSEPNSFYYFAYFKEKCVGILRFLQNHGTQEIKEIHSTKLHRIYLDPATHGKGIGKSIIQWLTQFSRTQNQESIWLECMDTQLPAYQFYKRLGFETITSFILDAPSMRPEMRGMFLMKLDVSQ